MPESPADERDLRFDVEDGVAIVTINRPARSTPSRGP